MFLWWKKRRRKKKLYPRINLRPPPPPFNNNNKLYVYRKEINKWTCIALETVHPARFMILEILLNLNINDSNTRYSGKNDSQILGLSYC